MEGMATIMTTVTAMATVMTIMTTIPPDTITILAAEAVILLDQDTGPGIDDEEKARGAAYGSLLLPLSFNVCS